MSFKIFIGHAVAPPVCVSAALKTSLAKLTKASVARVIQKPILAQADRVRFACQTRRRRVLVPQKPLGRQPILRATAVSMRLFLLAGAIRLTAAKRGKTRAA